MQKSIQMQLDSWFLRPFVTLSAIERRNAYLIIALSLVALITIGIRAFLVVVAQDVVYYVAFGMTFLAYILGRYGRLKISGILILTLLTTPSIISLYNTPVYDNFDPVTRILWIIFPLILASIFFSLRGLAIYAVICGVVIILAPLYRVDMNFISVSIAFGFFSVNAILLLVVLAHRNYIERLRQQELQEANDKLRQSERVLEKRVIERTNELNVAKLEAEHSNQVKSQFLASMSHELRTPLNAILNFTRFNLMGIYGTLAPRQKDSMEKIVSSAQHLLDLINDVLDIAKIEANLMQLFVEDDVNLNVELGGVLSSGETLLVNKPKTVQLINDIDDNLPVIVGDRRRIRQIVLNLVSNACKFTDEGSVTVSAKHHGDEIHIAVLDTGPGIPSDKLEIIFEPFQQTETGIKHSGGTGLGLPIAKRLVESHYGRMWLETSYGEGSAFHVVLPTHAKQLVAMMTTETATPHV